MRILRFILLFIVVGACIDPLNISSNAKQDYLVVDGIIADRDGSVSVKLYNSLALVDQLDHATLISSAKVSIFKGDTEVPLTVASDGSYTSTMKGEVGTTYKLKITTADGAVYESSPELLRPVGDFTNLRSEFVQPESTTGSTPLNTKNGFKIYLDANVLPEQQGLVRWRWTGTFEIFTYPELRVKIVTNRQGVQTVVPDPVPCSGYVVVSGSIMQRSACTCCDCYVTQYNPNPILSDKAFITNNVIPDVDIAFIPANRRFLYSKYYLSVDQLSSSQPVYDFWKKVLDQKEKGSDLFQTPPGQTRGNITLVSGTGLPPIGVFTATSIKTHTIAVTRDQIPYALEPIDTLAVSCTAVYVNSTTTKPAFW